MQYCGDNGLYKYAGIHLIVDIWKGRNFDNLSEIDRIIRACVQACGATLLSIDLHEFTPFGGVSGVAVLQESHISIHTWPEYEYAAMDIFVCGTLDPGNAIPVIKKGFETESLQITEIKRGIF